MDEETIDFSNLFTKEKKLASKVGKTQRAATPVVGRKRHRADNEHNKDNRNAKKTKGTQGESQREPRRESATAVPGVNLAKRAPPEKKRERPDRRATNSCIALCGIGSQLTSCLAQCTCPRCQEENALAFPKRRACHRPNHHLLADHALDAATHSQCLCRPVPHPCFPGRPNGPLPTTAHTSKPSGKGLALPSQHTADGAQSTHLRPSAKGKSQQANANQDQQRQHRQQDKDKGKERAGGPADAAAGAGRKAKPGRASGGRDSYPYDVDYNDHFETSLRAVQDVAVVLHHLCRHVRAQGGGPRGAGRQGDGNGTELGRGAYQGSGDRSLLVMIALPGASC